MQPVAIPLTTNGRYVFTRGTPSGDERWSGAGERTRRAEAVPSALRGRSSGRGRADRPGRRLRLAVLDGDDEGARVGAELHRLPGREGDLVREQAAQVVVLDGVERGDHVLPGGAGTHVGQGLAQRLEAGPREARRALPPVA